MANSFLFTSESVSEGHPDKVADQISDAVLDAILAVDPRGRVACETLIKTGVVIVAGRGDHLRLDRSGEAGARDGAGDRLQQLGDGVRRRQLRRRQHHRQAIARHRHGRRSQDQAQAGRRRSGIDVRLRHQRDRRADARADHPRPPPGQAPGRGAQARQARLAPARCQEPDHAALRKRSAGGDRSGGALHPAQPGRVHQETARGGDGRDHQAGAARSAGSRSAPSTTSIRPVASWSAVRWATAA